MEEPDLEGIRKTFGLATTQDVLEKLRWEIERFKHTEDLRQQRFNAWNCAVTAWAVVDWIYNSWSVDQKVKMSLLIGAGITKKKGPLHQYLFDRFPVLRLARQMATGSKHRIVKEWNIETVYDVASTEPTIMVVGVPYLPSKVHVKVVDGPDDRWRIVPLFEKLHDDLTALVAEWKVDH